MYEIKMYYVEDCLTYLIKILKQRVLNVFKNMMKL